MALTRSAGSQPPGRTSLYVHASPRMIVVLREQPVQFGRGLADHLRLDVVRYPLEVPGNHIARARPGRQRVRVVGRPHEVVATPERPVGDPDRVVHEGGEDLSLEISAGQE